MSNKDKVNEFSMGALVPQSTCPSCGYDSRNGHLDGALRLFREIPFTLFNLKGVERLELELELEPERDIKPDNRDLKPENRGED